MIEVNSLWDMLPNANQQAYAEFSKKAIGSMLQAPGLVEFRANRNILGSPKIRVTTVWHTLSDWAKFNESAEWQALELELHAFTTNTSTEIWGPSPVVPEPLRPGR
jgi:heme-degrading monooxygenase HmoA